MTYNSRQADKAQAKYCKDGGLPHFAPETCWRCRQNIYAETGHPAASHLSNGGVILNYAVDVPGISVEEAAETFITGCPFCFRSFCE